MGGIPPYELRIGLTPDNLVPVFNTPLTTPEVYLNFRGVFHPNTRYYWQIIASPNDSNREEGEVFSFQTDGEKYAACAAQPTVTHLGITYRTVQIQGTCWMAENLRVGTQSNTEYNTCSVVNSSAKNMFCDNGKTEHFCPLGDPSCTKDALYTRFELFTYDFERAQTICPNGWTLPDRLAFNALANYAGNDLHQDNRISTAFHGWAQTFSPAPFDSGEELQTCSAAGDSYTCSRPVSGSSTNRGSLSAYWIAGTRNEDGEYPYYSIWRNPDNNLAFGNLDDGFQEPGTAMSVRCIRQ